MYKQLLRFLTHPLGEKYFKYYIDAIIGIFVGDQEDVLKYILARIPKEVTEISYIGVYCSRDFYGTTQSAHIRLHSERGAYNSVYITSKQYKRLKTFWEYELHAMFDKSRHTIMVNQEELCSV